MHASSGGAFAVTCVHEAQKSKPGPLVVLLLSDAPQRCAGANQLPGRAESAVQCGGANRPTERHAADHSSCRHSFADEADSAPPHHFGDRRFGSLSRDFISRDRRRPHRHSGEDSRVRSRRKEPSPWPHAWPSSPANALHAIHSSRWPRACHFWKPAEPAWLGGPPHNRRAGHPRTCRSDRRRRLYSRLDDGPWSPHRVHWTHRNRG